MRAIPTLPEGESPNQPQLAASAAPEAAPVAAHQAASRQLWAWLRVGLKSPRGALGGGLALAGLVVELSALASLVPLAGRAALHLGEPKALAPVAAGIVGAYLLKGLGGWARAVGANMVASQAALAARLSALGLWPLQPGLEAKAIEASAGLAADASALRLALGAWLDALPLGLGAIALALSAALATSWRLVLGATLASLLMAGAARWVGRLAAPSTEKTLSLGRSAQAEVAALLARAPLWRAARRPEALLEGAMPQQLALAVAEQSQMRFEALAPALLGALQALAIAALALAGAHEAAAGRLGAAELGALGAALGLAIDPALGLAAALSRWHAAHAALKALPLPQQHPNTSLEPLSSRPPEGEARPEAEARPSRGGGHLVVEGLSAGAPGGPVAFTRLTFELAPGSRCLLEGPNGAGKSSLLATLAGAWPALEGQLWLDGLPLGPAPPGAVSWAPQQPWLVGPCVEDDLRLFAPQAPRDFLALLWQSLGGGESAHLEDPVALLHADRSGGQAARLGLARALAAQPSLLLLDEASAHLDAAGRQALLAWLARPDACGSAIVASHDPEWRSWANHSLRPWGP